MNKKLLALGLIAGIFAAQEGQAAAQIAAAVYEHPGAGLTVGPNGAAFTAAQTFFGEADLVSEGTITANSNDVTMTGVLAARAYTSTEATAAVFGEADTEASGPLATAVRTLTTGGTLVGIVVPTAVTDDSITHALPALGYAVAQSGMHLVDHGTDEFTGDATTLAQHLAASTSIITNRMIGSARAMGVAADSTARQTAYAAAVAGIGAAITTAGAAPVIDLGMTTSAPACTFVGGGQARMKLALAASTSAIIMADDLAGAQYMDLAVSGVSGVSTAATAVQAAITATGDMTFTGGATPDDVTVSAPFKAFGGVTITGPSGKTLIFRAPVTLG